MPEAQDQSNRLLLSGNHAVSWGVKLARPDVTPVYPITPQTPILEKLTDFQSEGTFDAEVLTPESEHSAMAACISASLTGARVFTATSSQGIMLMHELLHYASGARAPIVMFNVNRTVGSPWGFWPDQLDSLAQRDTGWIQIYSETPQESLDTVIQAFRIAEAAALPAMVCHDAFYVSHSVEEVEVPSQDLVNNFLPAYEPEICLDTGIGKSFGAPVDQANWNRSRQEMAGAMATVEDIVNSTGQQWGTVTSRGYGALEHYRAADAEVVIVTMGSMCGTVREVVDTLRDDGIAAGLLKVRLFRPLPTQSLRQALAGVPCALVLDRNYSPGMGGVLHQELKSALFGMTDSPRLHGILAGVGGVNVPPSKIRHLVSQFREAEPSVESVWME
ncbi:MAG: pyruvate ferredoxin oxidoreductase [Dehalococcoidales bacterium]|jgi:pyruvate/2-oxoacid:ferredoxin oxidoreductase alpha subunit|nr:pyruvate ferredoxin oxidoreductase [Dehalococcoidales bacterium]|tara:strand:+ start:2303 stop:3469 length:1167 start_codon:yes stop_codon:yes gene_type:complete